MPALSPREREALQLLATGMSYKQAACQMHIAVSTLKYYLYQARWKLNQPNVIATVAASIQLGLVVIVVQLDRVTLTVDCVSV